jgi:hypothetical protein
MGEFAKQYKVTDSGGGADMFASIPGVAVPGVTMFNKCLTKLLYRV